MEEKLSEIKAYPLSNDDIQEILQPDTKIFTYPALGDMSHIDEAFDSLGRCIFLYLTENESTGHWCCMWKVAPDCIYYFDPYGEHPDEPLTWLSPQKNIQNGQDEPYLTKLLRQSGYKVFCNNVKYQKERSDVATCGRHCVARLVLKDCNSKRYNQIIRASRMSPDDFVTLLTYEVLGK